MGLPVSVESTRKFPVDLLKVPVFGGFFLLSGALFPGVLLLTGAAAVSEAAGGPRLSEDEAFAFGLLLACPWNLLLKLLGVHIRIFWVPAWAFALVMGAFGLVKGLT